MSKGSLFYSWTDLIHHSWFDKLTTNGGLNQFLLNVP
jgi:hypothetical protein